MSHPTNEEVKAEMMSWPGKRSIDIPADVFDRIHGVANGITQQVWGTYPTPQQLQFLHDGGHHTPEAIHGVYAAMPHPHAPSVSVGEYQKFSDAHALFAKHQGKP